MRSEKKSEVGPPKSANSVFDFLYQDSERVASFLSQFEPNGHLTNLKQTLGASEAATSSTALHGAGTAGIVKGGMNATSTAADTTTNSAERNYDPLWSNALRLLEHLEAFNLIERNIWNANIGQFVLVKGILSVLDVAMLKAAWSLPSVKKAMKAGIQEQAEGTRQQRRSSDRQPKKTTPEEDGLELAVELLGILPHMVQARFVGDDYFAWCTLRQERLLTSSGDLLLKHGMHLSGEWAAIGILDAQPQAVEAPEPDASLGVASAFLSHLAVPTRAVLGRPEMAHGITPLLIFRQVSG